MVVLAPLSSLTLPSGRAKPLVRGEVDGDPAAYPQEGSWEGQWPSGLLRERFRSHGVPPDVVRLHWAWWSADDEEACHCRVLQAWPVPRCVAGEGNLHAVATWSFAVVGDLEVSVVPAQLL